MVDSTGASYVQAHVATLYGVSRELLIPVGHAPAPKVGDAAKPGFSVGDAKLSIRYAFRNEPDGKYTPVLTRVSDGVKLKWFAPTGVVAVDYRGELEFDLGGITVPCECGAKAVASNAGELTIGADGLKRIAADLFRQKAVQDRVADGNRADRGRVPGHAVLFWRDVWA